MGVWQSWLKWRIEVWMPVHSGAQDIEIRSHIIALGSGTSYSPDELPVVTGSSGDSTASSKAFLMYLPATVRSIRV